MKIEPMKLEVLLDGKPVSEFFEDLQKKISDSKQGEIGYGTKVKMGTEYDWITGVITKVVIDKRGVEYDIDFDTHYRYDKGVDGWYHQNNATVKRNKFTVL